MSKSVSTPKRIKTKEVYLAVYHYLKSKKLRIVHRTLNGCAAELFPETKLVRIDKKHRNKAYGSLCLLHEYIHYLQWEARNHVPMYKEFFDIAVSEQDTVYSYDKMLIVEAVELEADRKAKELLETFGTKMHPKELSEHNREKNIKLWRDAYFVNGNQTGKAQ